MSSLQTLWMPSPNCWQGRFGAVPRYVIVHGTAGFKTAQQVAEYFATTESQVSSHYVVGQDGAIIACVSEANGAWANGGISGPAGTGGDGVHHDAWWDSSPLWNGAPNPNLTTISIEHVKPHDDNSDTLTALQQAASFALIKDICVRNAIPMRAADASGGITGHYSMDPVNKSRCPGPYPWSALWAYLGQSGTTPQGWHDDGVILTAPNKIPVVRGFREYVLTHSWDAGNWPLEAEHGQTPLEQSNPSLGGGTQQIFRWTVLEYTSSRGVFVAWCGQEMLWMRAKLSASKASS